MRTALICTVEPEAFVDLDDVKAQLRVTSAADDALLNSLISVACASLEGADGLLKRAVAAQTWKLVLPAFVDPCESAGRLRLAANAARPSNSVLLPLPPAQSVTAISYADANGAPQTLAADAWRLVDCGTEPSFLLPTSSWPVTDRRPDAVSITFKAGYAGEVPRPIWASAILIIKQLHELGARNVFVTGETVFGVGSKTFAVSSAAAQVAQDVVDRLLFNYRILGR